VEEIEHIPEPTTICITKEQFNDLLELGTRYSNDEAYSHLLNGCSKPYSEAIEDWNRKGQEFHFYNVR